jgi:hypothetical protein
LTLVSELVGCSVCVRIYPVKLQGVSGKLSLESAIRLCSPFFVTDFRSIIQSIERPVSVVNDAYASRKLDPVYSIG